MKEMLRNIPKIELHLHLDGSVRIKTVAELLQIEESLAYSKMVCDKNTHSLTDYLMKFELPLQILQTTENLKRVTRELLEDLKQEHVIYVELRFAPQFHTREGLSQKEVVKAVLEEIQKVEKIHCNLILCCMRQDLLAQNKNNLETIHVAKEFYGKGVVGLDLAGDESKYPNDQFETLFSKMKEMKIPYTIHAGEAAGSESIRKAIQLGASRIGHGIHAVQDPELLEELKKRKIVLEVCPQSNIDTCAVRTKEEHPIRELIQNVFVTINTDNRTVSHITLTDEYEDLMLHCGFTLQDLLHCNLNAVEYAFLECNEKEKMKKQIEEGFYDATYRS